MTGKDFGLVLFVAVAASAGTAAAAHVLRSDDGTADRMNSLATKLDRIEQALAKSEETARKSGADLTDLRERMTGLETRSVSVDPRVGSAPDSSPETVALREPVRHGRAKRIVLPSGAESIRFGAGAPGGTDADGEFDVHITRALDDASAALGGELQGLGNGLRMRMLPEAERWAKAKEELNLTDGQVDLIKRAAADRDAAMKDAMQVTKEGETGRGGRISIRSLDPAKATAAQEAFKSTVNQTLDDGQKKTWKEKGYDHAFGSGPGSGHGAVLIASEINIGAPEEKSPK